MFFTLPNNYYAELMSHYTECQRNELFRLPNKRFAIRLVKKRFSSGAVLFWFLQEREAT